MNQRINNICKVEVARRSEVAAFYETPTGLVVMSAPWTQVPLARNASLSYNRVNTPAGYRHDIDFRANLSQAWMLTELCLVRIYFADDTEPMLIGSMDFPVRFAEQHSLVGKSLDFSHSNTHYPYRIAPDTPIGSGGSDPGPEPEPVDVTIDWELSEWDSGGDFIDANMRIFANEVQLLEQFGNGSGGIGVFEGQTIRVQYSYLDIAEGSPVSPFIQLLIDAVVIESQPVEIPGTGTFNYSFVIDSNKQILVRAIDLG